MSKKVLLVGRNPRVLSKLAGALRNEGLLVWTTDLVERASRDFDAAAFELIAFGRGVDGTTNAQLKADFIRQNPNILFVDGLAPVIPLLVRQISLALQEKTTTEDVLTLFGYQQPEIHVSVGTACQLAIELYQLDETHTTRQQTLVNTFVEAGDHIFLATSEAEADYTINFLVAEVNHSELAVLVL